MDGKKEGPVHETGEKNERDMEEEIMKKYFAMLLCVAVSLLLAGTAMAFSGSYTAGTGINGTPHDIPALGGSYAPSPADPLNRVCIYCHAPHHAYKLNAAGAGTGTGELAPVEYDYLPLWNHAVTTQSFQTYDPGPGAPTEGWKAPQSRGNSTVGASSLLCLSCHDGTIAVNQYGHNPQDPKSQSTTSGTLGRIAPQYMIGKDGYLNNHHPIGFDYDTVAGADLEIYTSSAGTFGSKPIAGFLYNGKMECATCHAVHNTGNSGEKLLYVSDTSSNLCLSCHKKGAKR